MGFPYEKEPWQLEDLEIIIQSVVFPIGEVLVIRARNGSKTEDMILLALYLCYLGYDVIFFAAQESQIRKPQQYLADFIDRSFLQYLVGEQAKRSVYFEGGGSVQLLNLTEKQARSPRADCIIFDEEAQADINAYRASDGIMKSSQLGLKVHCSTPIKGSIFEENCDNLKKREKKYKQPLVLERKCWDIKFLMKNRAQYEAEKEYYDSIGMGWFFRQENECTFENPHGAIFRSVIYDSEDINKYIEQNNLVFTDNLFCGLDWNPVAGHYIVAGRWSRDKTAFLVYNVLCLKMGYSHEMSRDNYLQISPYMTDGNKLGVEAGGINEAHCDMLRKHMGDGSIIPKQVWFEEWDSSGKNKYNAVMNLISKMLLIDKSKFGVLAKEVSEAHWDDKSTEPKLYKNPSDSPHALDALLHAVSPELDRTYRVGSFRWR